MSIPVPNCHNQLPEIPHGFKGMHDSITMDENKVSSLRELGLLDETGSMQARGNAKQSFNSNVPTNR